MSDSEIFEECPLCLEEIDILDSNFKPCPCGYQICMFCYEKICSGNTKCPACRQTYTEDRIQNDPVTPQQIAKAKARKAPKEQSIGPEIVDRKNLPNARVEQKDLVYVLGFSSKYCDEELLRKQDYFGQFGNIVKLNISQRSKVGNQTAFAVYVTYSAHEEAARAIYALDGCEVDGKILKACYGTTKYCANFLKHMPCTNPSCLYLHELTKDSDYAISTSNRFSLKAAAPPFPSQSSSLKRAEKRPVNRGYSINVQDLRGSALPATASWAKGPGSGLEMGSKPPDAATDFPALLPVRPDSTRTPKPSNKRKDRRDNQESSVPKPRPQSPLTETNFYEDLLHTDNATPFTKTPADSASVTLPDPLSDNDNVYSSDEKEDLAQSDHEDSEWEQLPDELRAPSPGVSEDYEVAGEAPAASLHEAFVSSETVPTQHPSPFIPEEVPTALFPLEVTLDPLPNSPRLEYGRVVRMDGGVSRFEFAQYRSRVSPPALPADHIPQTWSADHYVEGLLSSPELTPFVPGFDISISDLFSQAERISSHPPPRLPQPPQQLPPKQKQGSRFFKSKPQPEPQFKPPRYPHYATDPSQGVYPGRPAELEHERAHLRAHDFVYPALRPSFADPSPPHFFKPQPLFFPVPDEPSFFRPPPSEPSHPLQDPFREYPKDNLRFPQTEFREAFAPRGMAPGFEFRAPSYPPSMTMGFQFPRQEPSQASFHELLQKFPEVPSHPLGRDFEAGNLSQEHPAAVFGEPEEVDVVSEVLVVEAPVLPKEEIILVEPPRPVTPPPMPKLAFDLIPTFRSSLDKPLSNEHSLLIQKELSTVYALLLAAIEGLPEPAVVAPLEGEKVRRLEAKAALIQAKPLSDFSPMSAHIALSKEAQHALQQTTSLSSRLQNLSVNFNYKFDINFEL